MATPAVTGLFFSVANLSPTNLSGTNAVGLSGGERPFVLDSPLIWVALVLVLSTILWDLVELWTRYHSFSYARTTPFRLYAAYHLVIGAIAAYLLSMKSQNPLLVGLVATVSSEMVISNANIKLGESSLLPIVDHFRALRAAMQQELDKVRDAALRAFHSQLQALPKAILRREVQNLLIQTGDAVEVTTKLDALEQQLHGNPDALRSKLAWDLISLDETYARNQLAKWQAEAA